MIFNDELLAKAAQKIKELQENKYINVVMTNRVYSDVYLHLMYVMLTSFDIPFRSLKNKCDWKIMIYPTDAQIKEYNDFKSSIAKP